MGKELVDLANMCKRIDEEAVQQLKKELFNKPDYYHKGGIDVLGYLEQHFPTEGTYTVAEGFYIGNIIKYVSRYKGKNKLKDLEKATDYLNLLCEIEKSLPRKQATEEKEIADLLTDAYETDDIFAKNALLLQAMNLLEADGTNK